MSKKAISKEDIKHISGGVRDRADDDLKMIITKSSGTGKEQSKQKFGDALLTATGSNPMADIWSKILVALGFKK